MPITESAQLHVSLTPEQSARIESVLQSWTSQGTVARVWAKDPSVWTSCGEERWLGWLSITEAELNRISEIEAFQADVKARGFKHILLLGMGGSSLCPEVLRMTFGVIPGYPELHVLDSTDPAQVASFAHRCPSAETLFIVASKSGGTLEPNILKQFFFDRATQDLGSAAGSHFVAVTDPGSHMEQVAKTDQFWRIFYGEPTVGGRYSALSAFGTTAMAAMGLDVRKVLTRALPMVEACRTADLGANPGGALGAILGALGVAGRDKVTFFMTPTLWDFGAWLEQLTAESTGKLGKAIIPVDLEGITTPSHYGSDRVFVHVTLDGEEDPQSTSVEALAAAGHPVVKIALSSTEDLGAEFFRWEFAIAVAGAVLEINPFDQPDVEASKIVTKKLTTAYEATRSLPPETPIASDCSLTLFTDPRNEAILKAAAPSGAVPDLIKALLNQINPGDYFALLAYVAMTDAHRDILQDIRHHVRDQKTIATCLGFGPRFLHSTGQAYKGGPNTGVFLQITCDDAVDLPVPSQSYTFGVVKAAQARGDFEVLAERGRRALRVHLPVDVSNGLSTLLNIVRGVI
ncbi:MAG: hypothetical protein OHK005_05330 [Candidatus Methylacidiphilales bacterium]